MPKHLGGLGVGDLVVKNAGLLFKWWLHFLDGDDSLWKKVILSNRYHLPNSKALTIKEGDKGGLWGQIISTSYNHEVVNDVLSKVGKLSTNYCCYQVCSLGLLSVLCP